MLSNWTRATTTTTGTGTITLDAVSGYPRPSDAFVTGALVAYSIVTSDGKAESGIGKVSASNTLARTRVNATYNGSTYNNTTATALSLAAGTHNVYVDRVAEAGHVPCMMPYTIPANRFAGPANADSTQTNVVIAAANQRQTAYPFLLASGGILTGFAGNCSVIGTSSTTLIGLYEITSNGGPGRRIAKTSSAITTSTTGFKSQAVDANVAVLPGWYWLAVNVNAGSTCPSFTGGKLTGHFAGMSGANMVSVMRSDDSSSTLDDPFLTTNLVIGGASGDSIPYIGLVLS